MILYKVRVPLANTMFYGVLRAFTNSVSATLKYNVNVALCRKDGLRKCIGLPFLTSSCYYGKCSTSYFQYIAKNMFLLIYVKQFLSRLILFLTKIKAQEWISLSPTPPFVSLIIFTGHLRWSTFLRISTEGKIKCSWPLPRDAIVLLLFSHIFLYCLPLHALSQNLVVKI